MSMFTSTPFPPQEGEASGVGRRFSTSSRAARQSYAYPLQQVFEETRSMLYDRRSMVGEASVFEMTLGRARNRLTASGPNDFIGAMESLHHHFGISIQAMTDRSQIFEVISEWIADIELALQHQKNNETDLSDSCIRKLQSLLWKEFETWNLIKLLYFDRLYDDGSLVDAPFNQVIRDKFCVNEEPYVHAIVNSDPALREMYTIMMWLETNFQKNGAPDLNEKFFIWEQTWETIKRDQLVGKPSSKTMVSKVDPDAPSREGKQLHPLDDEENNKVLRGAYYYVRTGNIENAISYLVKSGDKIKASTLSGYQYTAKTQRDPETGEEVAAKTHAILPSMEYLPKAKRQARPNPDFDIRGNRKRDLWKQITWKVCEKKTLSKYDRALLGAACGHRDAMLSVCQTWEDRLWAYLKASTDVFVENSLRNASVPNTRKELPESYWAQRLSVAECIEKADALSKPEPENSPEYFFQLLQKCIMMDKLDYFIDQLQAEMPKLMEAYGHPLLNGHLVRFFSHLLLFLGIVDLPYSQQLVDVCLDNYITVLVNSHRLLQIPFYVQKLSDDIKIPTVVRHIKAEERLSQEDIDEFLRASQVNELDVLGIGIAVVDKMRDEEDDFSVENLDWIRCCYGIVENSSQVMYEFLKYTIWISRKYLTLGNIEKVKTLIGQVTPENVREVAEMSEVLENTLVREYVCYRVYLDAEAELAEWKKVISQRPIPEDSQLPPNASLADRTVYDKKKREHEAKEASWQRAFNFRLNNAIDKFLDILKFPLGWLHDCYNPLDEDELIHVGAVRRIILKKVVHILLRLVQDKNDNRTTRDFIYILCDDGRKILEELLPGEIANVFKVVEQFTRQKVDNIMYLPK